MLRCAHRHAAQCNAHPRPNDETVHSRAIWLTTFWKRADPFVGVCWNVGMSDGFCVGRGILHLTGYAGLMMDETGDYACGNHHARCAPFETLVYVHKDTRMYARVRACTGPRGPFAGGFARGGFRLIPRDHLAKSDDDGDEFLQGFLQRFDNLTAAPHRAR